MTGRLLGTENSVTYQRYEKVVQMGTGSFAEIIPYAVGKAFGLGTSPGTFFIGPPGSQQGRVDYVWCSNNSASDHVLRLTQQTPADNSVLGEVTVPAGAGFGGAPPVDAIALLLGVGNPGIWFDPQQALIVDCPDTLTGTDVVALTAYGGTL